MQYGTPTASTVFWPVVLRKAFGVHHECPCAGVKSHSRIRRGPVGVGGTDIHAAVHAATGTAPRRFRRPRFMSRGRSTIRRSVKAGYNWLSSRSSIVLYLRAARTRWAWVPGRFLEFRRRCDPL